MLKELSNLDLLKVSGGGKYTNYCNNNTICRICQKKIPPEKSYYVRLAYVNFKDEEIHYLDPVQNIGSKSCLERFLSETPKSFKVYPTTGGPAEWILRVPTQDIAIRFMQHRKTL